MTTGPEELELNASDQFEKWQARCRFVSRSGQEVANLLTAKSQMEATTNAGKILQRRVRTSPRFAPHSRYIL